MYMSMCYFREWSRLRAKEIASHATRVSEGFKFKDGAAVRSCSTKKAFYVTPFRRGVARVNSTIFVSTMFVLVNKN